MKVIEVIADAGHHDTVRGIAEQHDITEIWFGPLNDDGRQVARLLVGPDKRQTVLDALQAVLGTSTNARILVTPVEAVLPFAEDDDDRSRRSTGTTREELLNQIEKGARLDSEYLLLVALSTVVAAIGLIENNVAVIIGAMVIAPLLGPNLAFALATALGDGERMASAFRSLVIGLSLALVLALAIGYLWPVNVHSAELISRTTVGLSGAILALASGAAAILSLTTGVASVLVGVMVAVALLPPTVAVGILLGTADFTEAAGATVLLAVNIVCVNLAASTVFLLRGIKPRRWMDIRRARRFLLVSMAFWTAILFGLMTLIDAW